MGGISKNFLLGCVWNLDHRFVDEFCLGKRNDEAGVEVKKLNLWVDFPIIFYLLIN